MRRVFILCFGIAALFIGMAPAYAFDCSSSTPNVRVKTLTTPTKYIQGKSSKDLTQMHGASGKNTSVGGLGGGEIGFDTETRFEITESEGLACVVLTGVDVIFYAKPEVHVASNFQRGSCEYNAVIEHEQKHIKTLRAFVREYSPQVKARVAALTRQSPSVIGPVKLSQIDAAQNKLQQTLMQKIETYSAQIIPILGARQSQIDVPEEYERVSAQCRKWNKNLKGE